MAKLLQMALAAVFTNNIILSKFLGICPFMGVSKSTKTAVGMGFAVLFVTVSSSLITFALYHFLLAPYQIEYMQLICFVLIIATFVQMVELFTKRYLPSLYKSLGIYLPLVTTNCAVLYVAQYNITMEYTFFETLWNATATSLGFIIVMYIFACIRERLDYADTLPSWKGNPIGLVVAGLMALAFSGLAGLF